MIMVALVRSWQDLAKILASIPMHLGKRAKIRVTGKGQHYHKSVVVEDHLVQINRQLSSAELTTFTTWEMV